MSCFDYREVVKLKPKVQWLRSGSGHPLVKEAETEAAFNHRQQPCVLWFSSSVTIKVVTVVGLAICANRLKSSRDAGSFLTSLNQMNRSTATPAEIILTVEQSGISKPPVSRTSGEDEFLRERFTWVCVRLCVRVSVCVLVSWLG